jgi:hypothetical protein
VLSLGYNKSSTSCEPLKNGRKPPNIQTQKNPFLEGDFYYTNGVKNKSWIVWENPISPLVTVGILIYNKCPSSPQPTRAHLSSKNPILTKQTTKWASPLSLCSLLRHTVLSLILRSTRNLQISWMTNKWTILVSTIKLTPVTTQKNPVTHTCVRVQRVSVFSWVHCWWNNLRIFRMTKTLNISAKRVGWGGELHFLSDSFFSRRILEAWFI